MKQELNLIIKKGFLHIFNATFLNKVIQFGITIVLVRILSKDIYGQFIYAQNILSLFLLLEGLGTASAVLQFCSLDNEESDKLSYLKYGFKIGIFSDFVMLIFIVIFSKIYTIPIQGANRILEYMSAIPIISIVFNIIQSYLRATLKNREFFILIMSNSLIYFIGNILLGIIISVKGVILSRYLAFLCSCFLGIYILRNHLKKLKNIKYPSKSMKKEFLKFAITSSLTNAMSQILYLIDTFLVGVIVKDSMIVASYKTATLIPFNLTFIPLSIMVFVYPYFVKNCDDKKWIKNKYNKIQKYLIILNGLISLILFMFAPIIIKLLFGSGYLDSVLIFRILAIGYFIAGTFRIPGGNVLFSIKKVNINFYNAIISGISNILLDIILIKYYGSLGAAIATVLVFIISSLFSNIYLYKSLK